ncbi:hypothetical protein VTK73DRAFT_1795 [Phialemonium thermophilum]|uniref:Uncharacterized protein n=1 Tax=Phialemonium thermophilum TaxID=223376 RepID=A0ABR3VSZ2_9PEZI
MRVVERLVERGDAADARVGEGGFGVGEPALRAGAAEAPAGEEAALTLLAALGDVNVADRQLGAGSDLADGDDGEE